MANETQSMKRQNRTTTIKNRNWPEAFAAVATIFGPGISESQGERPSLFVRVSSHHLRQSRLSILPNPLPQCCTELKYPGLKILCVLYLHYNVPFKMIWKYLEQNVLFPELADLVYLQHTYMLFAGSLLSQSHDAIIFGCSLHKNNTRYALLTVSCFSELDVQCF